MLTPWLLLLYLIPLLSCLLLFFRRFPERLTVHISFVSIVLPFVNSIILTGIYVAGGMQPMTFDFFHLNIHGHVFPFLFYIDTLSLELLFLTGYLSLLVGKFSHTYLHREPGFQRFFRTILLFITGLELLALAGTFDLFFAAWEIIGFSSFLLIGFYRQRTRPAKNSFRIYCIYRLCDVGLLLGAILSHVLLHDQATFALLTSHHVRDILLQNASWLHPIAFLLLLSAIGKSGQFPFLNWPARAMEGPTPSSAIFYGALSIHCGVILLIRSRALWEHSNLMVTAMGVVGLLTIVFGVSIGRIQSNIKGQIAYAATVQIGIMFIELAFGLIEVAMIHFFCHALFRCYQILISPSIVVDLIKKLNIGATITLKKTSPRWYRRLLSTFYLIGLHEGFLEISERGSFGMLNIKAKIYARKLFGHHAMLIVFAASALVLAYILGHTRWHEWLAYFMAGLGLAQSLRALVLVERPKRLWNKIGISLIMLILAPLFFTPQDYLGACIYAFSAIPCWIIGHFALQGSALVDMNHFNGLQKMHQRQSRWFIISMIGLSGMPFTSTFLGEDILLAELVLPGPWLLLMLLMIITLNGLACARLLTKVFFGHPRLVKL